MIIGQTIVACSDRDLAKTTVYTPWIASFGNSAVFPFEVIDIGGVVTSFTAEVYTKNSEDADPGTAKGTMNSQTAAGTYSIDDAADLLELVRVKFVLSATEAGGCCTAFAHFRPLNPSWQTN